MITHPRRLEMLQTVRMMRGGTLLLAQVVEDHPELPALREDLAIAVQALKDYEASLARRDAEGWPESSAVDRFIYKINE